MNSERAGPALKVRTFVASRHDSSRAVLRCEVGEGNDGRHELGRPSFSVGEAIGVKLLSSETWLRTAVVSLGNRKRFRQHLSDDFGDGTVGHQCSYDLDPFVERIEMLSPAVGSISRKPFLGRQRQQLRSKTQNFGNGVRRQRARQSNPASIVIKLRLSHY